MARSPDRTTTAASAPAGYPRCDDMGSRSTGGENPLCRPGTTGPGHSGLRAVVTRVRGVGPGSGGIVSSLAGGAVDPLAEQVGVPVVA